QVIFLVDAAAEAGGTAKEPRQYASKTATKAQRLRANTNHPKVKTKKIPQSLIGQGVDFFDALSIFFGGEHLRFQGLRLPVSETRRGFSLNSREAGGRFLVKAAIHLGFRIAAVYKHLLHAFFPGFVQLIWTHIPLLKNIRGGDISHAIGLEKVGIVRKR